MKKNFEYFKNRAEDLVEDSVIFNTNPLNDKEGNVVEEFWNLSKSDKLLQILYILKKVTPEKIWSDIKEKLYNTSELPFNPNKFDFKGLFDRGGVAKVYLLDSRVQELPSYVFKVIKDGYFKMKDIPEEEGAKYLKQEYDQIKSWYPEEAQDVFLPEYIIRMKSPTRDKEALAILQPFQSGEIKDLFTDFSQKELVELLSENSELKNLFVNFSRATLEHEKHSGETLDFLGNKNLSIVQDEIDTRLIMLDPHVIFKTNDKNNNFGDRSKEKLDYLETILNRLEKISK